MRKKCLFGLLIFILLFAIISLIDNNLDKEVSFDSGKDTVESFGNGEYQLLNSSGNIGLFNCQYHECIVPIVDNWCKKDDNIYLTGKYPITFHDVSYIKVIINLSNNIINYYSEDIPFEKLNIVYANTMIANKKLVIVEDYNYFTANQKNIFEDLYTENIQ